MIRYSIILNLMSFIYGFYYKLFSLPRKDSCADPRGKSVIISTSEFDRLRNASTVITEDQRKEMEEKRKQEQGKLMVTVIF